MVGVSMPAWWMARGRADMHMSYLMRATVARRATHMPLQKWHHPLGGNVNRRHAIQRMNGRA